MSHSGEQPTPGYGQQGGWGAPPPGAWGPPGPPPQPGFGAPGGGYGGTGGYGPPPPNYLVWAILSTVFCCLPFGIVSIVFAAQVNARYAGGDVAGAQDASRKARIWAIASAATGLVIVLGYVALAVAVGLGGGFEPPATLSP